MRAPLWRGVSPALRHMHASPDADADWILSCGVFNIPLIARNADSGVSSSLQAIDVLVVSRRGVVFDADTDWTMWAVRHLRCLRMPAGESTAAGILIFKRRCQPTAFEGLEGKLLPEKFLFASTTRFTGCMHERPVRAQGPSTQAPKKICNQVSMLQAP